MELMIAVKDKSTALALSTSIYSRTGKLISVSPVEPQAKTVYAVTVRFNNREDAEEFREDMKMLQDPKMKESFLQADKESREGKAKPMKELYKEYGV